jgi:acyl carrier protein
VTSFIDDLESNSLDAMELILAFEGSFNVMIPDKAAEMFVTSAGLGRKTARLA